MPDTFLDPIVGFRTWNFYPGVGRLMPPVFGVAGAWSPGVNQAVCMTGHSMQAGLPIGSTPDQIRKHPVPFIQRHDAPAPGCKCGFYAHYDLSRLTHTLSVMVGAISAWGSIALHAKGFRTEFAQIIALAYPAGPRPLAPNGPIAARQGVVEKAAEIYDVPLVSRGELLTFASEYGALIQPFDGGPIEGATNS